MAGRDNVLFHASVASGTTAGTVIPLELLYGIGNVRQGLGTPRLKNIRALYGGMYSGATTSVSIEVKNSNWIDSAGLTAQSWAAEGVLNRDSLAFMRGRDMPLIPNTSWTINATLNSDTTADGDIYVILEIEYSDVAGFKTEEQPGCPVYKRCINNSVTGSANALVNLGSFDNLLENTEYLLSELTVSSSGILNSPTFVVIEGFTNQKGLCRIIPAKQTGMADQIEGSVKMTRQTYNLGIIRNAALSAVAVTVGMELIASKN